MTIHPNMLPILHFYASSYDLAVSFTVEQAARGITTLNFVFWSEALGRLPIPGIFFCPLTKQLGSCGF